jgi:hypothetical protein
VAFLVVSGGGNYNVQTGNGTTVKVYDFGTPNVDDYSGDINRPEDYDDVVKWVTLGELKTEARCPGSSLKILNNELPYGFVNSTYSATIFGDGGVPYQSGGKYRWCIEGSLPPGLSASPNTISSNCLSLNESSWGQSDNLTISGIPSSNSSGSYNIKVFIRDNNDPAGDEDNVYQKSFVITINPQTSGGPGGTAPPGFQIIFAGNTGKFAQSEGNSNAVQVDGNTLLSGGNVYGSQKHESFRYPGSYRPDGKTINGFTFTVMQAGAGSEPGYKGVPGSSVVMVDCTNCDDLTRNFPSNSTIHHCFALSADMSNVKSGFTEGTWRKLRNRIFLRGHHG